MDFGFVPDCLQGLVIRPSNKLWGTTKVLVDMLASPHNGQGRMFGLAAARFSRGKCPACIFNDTVVLAKYGANSNRDCINNNLSVLLVSK